MINAKEMTPKTYDDFLRLILQTLKIKENSQQYKN